MLVHVLASHGAEFNSSWGTSNREALEAARRRRETSPACSRTSDGEPVGWCSVRPREEFVRLERSRVLKRVDDRPAWSIACFYVQTDRRRQGVATALLEAAVAHAAAHGAELVEAYGCGPKDSDPFTGHLAMFEAVGFERSTTAGGGRSCGGRFRGSERVRLVGDGQAVAARDLLVETVDLGEQRCPARRRAAVAT